MDERENDPMQAWAHQQELEHQEIEERERMSQAAEKQAGANDSAENYFAELAKLDVSEHVEKKGQFSYLSWAWAVDRLRRLCPDATWEVKRFDGVPYLKTDCGHFVEVAVTVNGVTLSQIHPVLDGRNKPIPEPNAFDINTSIQRCLVKAIALHGLGLYIYAGEDLPEGVEQVRITAAQAADLQAMAKDVGADKKKFLAYIGADEFEDIPAARYDECVKLLESKRKSHAAH